MNPFKAGDWVTSSHFVNEKLEVLEVKDEHVMTVYGWFHYSKVEAIGNPFRDILEKLERHDLKTEQLATVTNIQEGKKYDGDKPDLSLLPKIALEHTARAFQYGEKKYGRYNYLGGMNWHRLIAAAMRHITAFNEGEDLDSESNISHLGHAMACLSMLSVFQSKGLGKDTRYKP